MVKQGACVIDVGINRVKNEKSGKTKLVGDVDFEGKSSKIFLLSPTTMSTVCNN
jgi:methylenetetrahydrofolate dehydrogenase(NAD+) / 5,10-methenyltetrahydrofolate cyclohydrolase